MTPRSALAPVLEALVEGDDDAHALWCDILRAVASSERPHLALRVDEDDVGVIVRAPSGPWAEPSPWYVEPRPWRHADPRDAAEALVACGLLPAHWSDPERSPRWWADDRWEWQPCGRCQASGTTQGGGSVCATCGGTGGCQASAIDEAPSMPALVAVACLGRDVLARLESLVAEAWPGAVLVWRVMASSRIEAHHRQSDGVGDLSLSRVFSHEKRRFAEPGRFGGEPAWGAACPWRWRGQPEIERAWPYLCEINRVGVHLIHCNPSPFPDSDRYVVIGVEALP